MPNPNVTRNQLWQKRLLTELPERLLRTFGVDADEVERLAREPGVFATEAENGIVLGQVMGDRLALHYAFDAVESMRLQFKEAFDQVEAEAATVPGVEQVEIQFNDVNNRPPIEIILFNSAFHRGEDWLLMGRRLPVEPADEPLPELLEDGAHYRPAAEADIEALVAIDAAAYGEAAVGGSVLASWLQRGHVFALVEREGHAVGYIAYQQQGQRGIVRRLGVGPDERRRGYGSALLARAVDALVRVGARRLELIIIPGAETIGFARANGLSQQGAGLTYRKKLGEKPEPTGLIIRGLGWSDMRSLSRR